MFTLHLDLHIQFVPPMSEHSTGVVLTREVTLPFAPAEDLVIFSKAFDECPEPGGFVLKGVTWDVDRGVFLAHTILVNQDVPMPMIPGMLRTWLDVGWRFGSCLDFYMVPEDDNGAATASPSEASGEPDEWEQAEGAHRMTWPQRDPEANRALRALIRHMVETFDNESAAYAFDRTGRFFTEHEIRERKLGDPIFEKFMEAERAFEKLSDGAKRRWRDRAARYPSLRDLVEGRP
jgi:hypothetical protein